jgi:hypothetical protein
MENENMSFQRHAKLFDFHPNYWELPFRNIANVQNQFQCQRAFVLMRINIIHDKHKFWLFIRKKATREKKNFEIWRKRDSSSLNE